MNGHLEGNALLARSTGSDLSSRTATDANMPRCMRDHEGSREDLELQPREVYRVR